MARLFTNGWGIVLALDDPETKILVNAVWVAAGVFGALEVTIQIADPDNVKQYVKVKVPPNDPAASSLGAVVTILLVYFTVEAFAISFAAEGGHGVDLTIPWIALPWGAWWLIIPTGRSQLGVSSNEDWTSGPYYGNYGTFFADVNGDGMADAIAVNYDGIYVRRSFRNSFGVTEKWASGTSFGSQGTFFFADVNGKGMADAIILKTDGIYVSLSSGVSNPGFLSPNKWADASAIGTKGTFFADVNGDGMADAIAVNDDGVYVSLSNGSSFLAATKWSSDIASFFADVDATFFADVDGNGNADAIFLKTDGIYVAPSLGSSFRFAWKWADASAIGTKGTFFADVGGGGKADAIAVNSDSGIIIRASTGTSFGPAMNLTDNAYYGDFGTFFADVNGDGCADAIVVNRLTVTVRSSMG